MIALFTEMYMNQLRSNFSFKKRVKTKKKLEKNSLFWLYVHRIFFILKVILISIKRLMSRRQILRNIKNTHSFLAKKKSYVKMTIIIVGIIINCEITGSYGRLENINFHRPCQVYYNILERARRSITVWYILTIIVIMSKNMKKKK